MDKWKDSELAKMKHGGNSKAREFLESQPDFRPEWTINEKYNSKAAALLRDKVATEAEGKEWSLEASPMRNYQPALLPNSGAGGMRKNVSAGSMGGGQAGRGQLDEFSDSFQNTTFESGQRFGLYLVIFPLFAFVHK